MKLRAAAANWQSCRDWVKKESHHTAEAETRGENLVLMTLMTQQDWYGTTLALDFLGEIGNISIVWAMCKSILCGLKAPLLMEMKKANQRYWETNLKCKRKKMCVEKKSLSSKSGQLWRSINIWQMDLMQSAIKKGTRGVLIEYQIWNETIWN